MKGSLMRRRLALGALLAGTALGSAVLALAPATSQGAPVHQRPATSIAPNATPTPTNDPAVTAFGSCIAGSRTGDVLLLIDESGSLEETDKSAARVTAAEYLVNRLAGYASTGKVKLSVSVAAFADTYRSVSQWTPLTSSSVSSVDGSLETLRRRHNGFDTDYWTALDGARKALEHQQDVTGTHCQAAMWFTDGQLDVEPRSTAQQRKQYGVTKPYNGSRKITSRAAAEAATAAASRDLCRPGGLADALRTDKVWTFAVGLEAGGNGGDFTLMRRIATGNPTCGSITSPVPGSFQLASNIDSLLFAFDDIAAPGQPGITNTSGVCQRTACARYQHAFVLDSSIRSVHVLGTSTASGVQVTVRGPTSAALSLGRPGSAGTRTIAGVAISWTWISDKSFELDMTEPTGDRGWAGQWSLIFVDPSGTSPNALSRTDIHITSDITAGWPGAASTTLRSGTTVGGIRLGLQRLDGSAVAASAIKGSIRLSAGLLDADGRKIATVADSLSTTTIGQPLSLDLKGVSPGKAALQLTLLVTTAPARLAGGGTIAGTTLSPQVTSVPLTIADPLNYPKVRGALTYGSITGHAHRAAQLRITGSGCVWLNATGTHALTTPADIGSVSLNSDATSRATCVHVGAGHADTLAVDLRTAHAGRGALKGTTVVALIPANGPGTPVMKTVPFTADLKRPLNSSVFALAFAIALALGIGIPILLLYLAKYVEARLPTGTLLAQRFAIEVTPDGVIRDGLPLSLRDRDFVASVTPVNRPSRSITLAGTHLRSTVTALPGTPCQVVVDEPGRVGISSGRAVSMDKKLRARLPLAVQNHWILLHDPAGAAEEAELLVIVGDASSQDSRATLFDDAGRRAPAMLGRLRAAARERGLVMSEGRAPAGVGFPGASDGRTESFPTDPFATGTGTQTGFPDAGFPGSSGGFTGGSGNESGTGFPTGGTGFPPAPDHPEGGTGFPGSSR